MTSVSPRFLRVAARLGAPRSRKFATRSYGSALFIPGNRASETFSLLSPRLDFDERFGDPTKLRRELELRGVEINAEELAKSWQFYKYMDANKWALEHRRSEIARDTKRLAKKKNLSCDEETEKIRLTTQGKVLKQEMRMIREAMWEMEETVVLEALRLPNVIDDKTPTDRAKILSSVREMNQPASDAVRSHLDIGASLGLIDYKNPLNYFLCDGAALFELATLSYAGERFADADAIRIAGTDFGRSLVVEAAGLDHLDPARVFVLGDNEGIDRETGNRLHLVGGATLVSFLAMHTKQLVNPNHFPLRYFAAGREYTPRMSDAAKNMGLFGVCQSSVVHVFAMLKDPLGVEYTDEFDKLSSTIASIYDDLEIHYRTVMRSAGELKAWESLRVSYEMWSAGLGRYVEIGHLSLCGRYFSKRLLIAYQTPTGRDFPAIISGTVISVPRLLACLLEEDPQKFRIPTKIAERMRAFYQN